MRHALIGSLILLLALPAWAAEEEVNEEVVKAVRAVISAKKKRDQDELKAQLFQRKDLDWPSVRKGLIEGPYYTKPLVTEFGLRHSGKHFGMRLKGEDGKERGFSVYVPKNYDATKPLPVLFFLHQGAMVPEPNHGAERAAQALMRFRKACDQYDVFFVAPYTSKGATWWMPEGQRLVEWTLDQVKRRYNIDENRVALMGNHDGGEGVWAIAQQMPGTFSCMMPMTADAYEVSAMVRPLYLGTLDRMPVLMGVTGRIQGSLGTKDLNKYLDDLGPMFKKNMKVTTAIYPYSQNDFAYLKDVQSTAMNWVVSKKRDALAVEVDIESSEPEGLRGLWLASTGYSGETDNAGNFPTTYLKWKAPKPADAQKKLGVNLQERPKWEVGIVVQRASGQSQRARIMPGDVIVEIGGEPVKKTGDVARVIKEYDFGTYVPVLIAREVKEDEVDRQLKLQEAYVKYHEQVRLLEADNKPIPNSLWDDMMDSVMEDEDDEEEDDEDSSIEISDGSEDGGEDEGAGGGDEDEVETKVLIFKRFVKLVRPDPAFVRADFGARVDHAWRKEGVRIGGVLEGGPAWRAGLREGDVISAVDGTPVSTQREIQACFEGFKFEGEKEGERTKTFTVNRAENSHELTANWDPPLAYRVDARWDRKETALQVKARKAKGFTLYFTDELVPPGKEFKLYINGVPWMDLVDPASAPKYPKISPHTDPVVHDRMVIMRKKRAKIEGWKPDLRWAVQNFLKHRDRELVLGAQRTFELDSVAMKEAFKQAREAAKPKKGKRDKGAKVKAAYDEYQAKG